MNKEEIIELIESLELESEDFVVLSTGALAIRGLFESAKDLLPLQFSSNDLKRRSVKWSPAVGAATAPS